ncbi:MAG: TIGR04190 family B12-binding domain/radical SAM domain protein [Planctomycetota bacterium]|nr:MAG: TIGR04190 family B12-binding domain/radical SAM domain protein [Planctomycetota bacterium]
MPKADFILLHAPAIYDFRDGDVAFGATSNVIPSSGVFEMYPAGWISMAGHLGRRGIRVRIVNLAYRMMRSRKFSVEDFIRKNRPRIAFGIDLHWLPHVSGSIEVAGICKKLHPDTPVIMGGLSASHFHEDLLRDYPVDFVVRGDCTEKPLEQLLRSIRSGRKPENIPNVSWKNETGKIVSNPLSHVPDDLSEMVLDYREMMRMVIRYRDIFSVVPFSGWLKYPIAIAVSVHGCRHACKTCGGSARFYHRTMCRKGVALRPPGKLARDLARIKRNMNGPIFLLGDLNQGGADYVRECFREIGRRKIRNAVVLELFKPPGEEFFKLAHEALPNWNMQISPESHDEKVRRAFGRPYGNGEFVETLDCAHRYGAGRIDQFHMIGLPHQDAESVRETVRWCGELLERFGKHKVLHPFIGPLAPFVDPGSEVWDNPKKFGYTMKFKTLEAHRLAMKSPSWKYMINYETEWMTCGEIVESAYESVLELEKIKAKHGVITAGQLAETEKAINIEKKLMDEVDGIMDIKDESERENALADFRARRRSENILSIADKSELEWPSGLLHFNPLRALILGLEEIL